MLFDAAISRTVIAAIDRPLTTMASSSCDQGSVPIVLSRAATRRT